MLLKIFYAFLGIISGMLIGYVLVIQTSIFPYEYKTYFSQNNFLAPKHKVIGFLPYWLLSKAQSDYSKDITTLSYFALTLDTNGGILKLNDNGDSEPGWYALFSGVANKKLQTAKKNGTTLSLVLFDSNNASIAALLRNPTQNADTTIAHIAPIMKKYNFTDLNLDIENVGIASIAAQQQFITYVREIKKNLENKNLGTLTLEISPNDLIKHNLINVKDIGRIADYVAVMAYDYHYVGSAVTGPVAPLSGAGTIFEYDTKTAIQYALALTPSNKLILGIPLYGYGWETIDNTPHAAIISETGVTVSSHYISSFLKTCATCSAQFDPISQETYLIYHDSETDTYHQFFYPNIQATQAKIDFAKSQKLAGIALWALGYEDSTILNSFTSY